MGKLFSLADVSLNSDFRGTNYRRGEGHHCIETQTVADNLLNYMGHMGFSSELFTDLGTSFTSKLMKMTSKMNEIDYIRPVSYTHLTLPTKA